jgi:arylsulfatase A-like enzyme
MKRLLPPPFLAAVLAVGCASTPSTAPAPEPDLKPELQGAVLVLLDTVRADHLSAYGHARQTSPALDSLARQGVLFEQVVSFAPWTLPSVASLLSGRRSDAVLVGDRLQASLIEGFAAAGFVTAAVTEGGFVSSAFGFNRGFATYAEEEGAVQLRQAGQPRELDPKGGIENTFRSAREWITAHRGERFFLMIHTYEPHTPYTRQTFTSGMSRGQIGDVFRIAMLKGLRSGATRLDAGELEYLDALYDGGILESDRHVGELLGFLERQGLRDRTLVVVTSDHGEELGEHYPAHAGDHGHALHDDQLLVPLIIHDPTGTQAVGRVGSQVRLFDVLPTMAEILGVPLPRGLDGQSLVPAMRGETQADRVAFGGSTKAGPPRAFVRHRGYKFIAVLDPRTTGKPLSGTVPRFQLYDLRADPGERQNLADGRPELTRQFLGVLQRLGSGPPGVVEVPEEVEGPLLERLRSLGYLR